MRTQRQTIPVAQRFTVKQFNEQFPTDEACLAALMENRWPGSVVFCVECKVDRKHYPIKGRTAYCCPKCGHHVFPLAGTIFHKSTTSLRTWFFVIKLMASTRCGISAKQIQRETGVTYKTAWRMMKQIRILMAEQIVTTGPVEMDEAYFGAPDKNKHSHLRGKEKTAVFGIVDRRAGKVIARVVPDASKETIFPIVREIVPAKSTIITDGHATYEQLRWMGQNHRHTVVNHSAGVYVQGWAHTNTIEGFWGLVKRGISGVYHRVGMDYLQSYLNEYSFRYNRRSVMRPMFTLMLERTSTQVVPCAFETKRLSAQS